MKKKNKSYNANQEHHQGRRKTPEMEAQKGTCQSNKSAKPAFSLVI
jgi:hypothetical protein